MDCLIGVVGVTKQDCECATGSLTDQEKENLAASSAGFHYLDDITSALDLARVRSLGACKSFYEMSTGALSKAINALKDDLTAGLAMKYPQKKGSYHGGIGQTRFSGDLSTASRPLQFMKIQAANEKSDAILTANRIKLFSNVAGQSKLYILDRDLNIIQEVDDITLNANTFTFVALPKALDLPLFHDYNAATYYFAWELPTGGLTKDNKVSCGCPGGDGWGSYVTVSGGQADTMDELLNATTDNRAHGLVIEGEIKCVTANFVCRQYSDKDAIAVVSKWAVAYKANEILVEAVLNSREVDRYSLLDREHLYGKRNHYKKEYETRVQYIIDNVDITSNDCFYCKDRRIGVYGILA